MNNKIKIVAILLTLSSIMGCKKETNNNASQTLNSVPTLRFGEKYIESSLIDGSVSIKYDYSIEPHYIFNDDFTGVYKVKYEYDYIYEREVVTNFKWTYADSYKNSIVISYTSDDISSKRDGKDEYVPGDTYTMTISEDVLNSSLGFVYLSETFAKKLGY